MTVLSGQDLAKVGDVEGLLERGDVMLGLAVPAFLGADGKTLAIATFGAVRLFDRALKELPRLLRKGSNTLELVDPFAESANMLLDDPGAFDRSVIVLGRLLNFGG